MIHSKGYILWKKPPIQGISDRSGTEYLFETPRINLLEAVPLMAVFAALVKKVVSATARILTTTPLMT